ncbi:MAG: hypothetical protein WCI89_03000 [bacterium]
MSKEMLVIGLGFLVLVIPQLGIPASWRGILLILAGVAIIAIGFLLRGEVISRGARGAEKNNFVEKVGSEKPEEL